MLARPWTSSNPPSIRAESDVAIPRLLTREDPVHQAIVKAVEEIAKERGVPMAAVSIAWCLSKGVSPIVGLNSKERIDEVVKAVKLVLSTEEIARLEAAYIPKKVIGF